MAAGIRHFSVTKTSFTAWGEGASRSALGRLIGTADSSSMGVGYLAVGEGDSIAWTVLYDEVLIVVSGTFRLRRRATVFEAIPGDVLWVPRGTTLAYEGLDAKVAYVLYPVDWRARHSAAASPA
ncbi:MAG: ethanolamine utilization protein EutQ [Proteobacteria bacterium]|nr:ethanolamine utilization protein EutQ [Pseudomonadota bacterium]